MGTKNRYWQYQSKAAAITAEVLLLKLVGDIFFSVIGGPGLTSFQLNVRKQSGELLEIGFFFYPLSEFTQMVL